MKKEALGEFNFLNEKGSKKADKLHQTLIKKGVDFVTGVPCGVLKHIISNASSDNRILHIPVNRESEAIGVAAGAYFSGKCPMVYMQNSGLFSASNDIASLLIPYRIPILFIISYRGCEGEDAIQHFATGRATEKLIDSFGLRFQILENQEIDALVEWIFEEMQEYSLPVMLLLKRGWDK